MVKTRKSDSRPTRFIYIRKPYFIRIRGKQVGEAQTLEEAQRIRDEWLKNNPL